MKNAQRVAESLLGHVEWQSPTEGLCLCPGERRHTYPTGIRDCRVLLDGVATVHCFHRSCGEAVEKANKELRRRLWNRRWCLVLPSGKRIEGLASNRGEIVTESPACAAEEAEETRRYWEGRLGEILERYRWPVERIEEESPRAVRRSDGHAQFSQWLCLWGEEDVIWIGDVHDSGLPAHARHFRTVRDWRRIGPVLGNFSCGCTFAAGTWKRSKAGVKERRFLIVESDELAKDAVGGVFRYLRDGLGYPLQAVVDTGGKSLHGWFLAPRTAAKEAALKICLTGLKCDPRMFSVTQPARLPGAWRDRKLQRLLYIV